MLIVIVLLAMIVVVLILPDVDLPDTAFQRNCSLQALRALSHPATTAGAHAACYRLSPQFEGSSIPQRQAPEDLACRSKDLPIQHLALRC
jgi:hypothetical protein